MSAKATGGEEPREPRITADEFNERGRDALPGHLGVEMVEVEWGRVRAAMKVGTDHMAPNGYLHAASVIALADTAAGCGSVASLPEGAAGFTTIELKSNFLGTVQAGAELECVAEAGHLGRTTQVWDAVVGERPGGRRIAVFRCTQLVLWGKGR